MYKWTVCVSLIQFIPYLFCPSATSRDDYDMNKRLRRAVRGIRKDEKARDQRRSALGLPASVKLVPENRADQLRAAAVDYGAGTAGGEGERGYQRNWKAAKRRIRSSDVFVQENATRERKRRLPMGLKLGLSSPGRF